MTHQDRTRGEGKVGKDLRARGWRPAEASDAAVLDPEPSTETGVMVVGANSVSSAGLSSLLRGAGLDVVGDAPGIGPGAAMTRRLRPDVILLDLDLPGPSGLAAIRQIAASAPRARVLVLFADDDLDLLGALQAGAYACILKDTPMREILAATRAAARGELVISPPVVRRLIGQMRTQATQESDALELTPRELEVLELLARGWDNGRIAAGLYVSRATVKRHISSILRKLDVDNRVQAAVRAVQEGILDG
jgi:DNA-binding NarL/FixJ family response regulator